MNHESVDQRVSLFAAQHHGIFTVTHLAEMKVSLHHRRRRLESGRWAVAYDGVYRITGAPRSWTSDLLAAVWAGDDRAVASHRSAAALWDLPGARRDQLEITCPRWRRAQESGLVVP